MDRETGYRQYAIEEYILTQEPFYLAVADEIDLFTAAFDQKIPVLLKGPTGCGKTRFIEYMAYRLGRPLTIIKDVAKSGDYQSKTGLPLVTVACHEDLTASDLVGRYLVKGGETVWVDGPLTKAVKAGGFCYLDEIVEARKDTTVVIHPLADDRRILPIEKRGEVIKAPPGFLLAISYNPGYQSVLKELKESTRQRFMALEFSYPPREMEARIVAHESGTDPDTALKLVLFAEKTRNLKDRGLAEGASTRLLIHAGKFIVSGIEPVLACRAAISEPLTDDREMLETLNGLLSSVF